MRVLVPAIHERFDLSLRTKSRRSLDLRAMEAIFRKPPISQIATYPKLGFFQKIDDSTNAVLIPHFTAYAFPNNEKSIRVPVLFNLQEAVVIMPPE